MAEVVCIKRASSLWTTCHCPKCVKLRARLNKAQYVGRYTRSTSEEAWQVLGPLIDDHWTGAALASATGLPPGSFHVTLARYRRDGTQTQLGPWTCHLILNMKRPTAGMVGLTGSRRRLQALARIGYGLGTLTRETGLKFGALSMIRNDKRAASSSRGHAIKAVNANAIADAYARLSMTPGDGQQARARAAEKGWHGPLEWDANTIDDPTALPFSQTWEPDEDNDGEVDEIVVDWILAGEWHLPCTHAERLAVIHRWLAAGHSQNRLAQLTGWNVNRELADERDRADGEKAS